MMCNKHAYPCLCFVQYAWKGEKGDDYCWTVICLTALLLQRWNFSSLFSAHNSFWQLHRHAIRLSCHANWVYRQSQRLVFRLSYMDVFVFLWGSTIPVSLYSSRPARGKSTSKCRIFSISVSPSHYVSDLMTNINTVMLAVSHFLW